MQFDRPERLLAAPPQLAVALVGCSLLGALIGCGDSAPVDELQFPPIDLIRVAENAVIDGSWTPPEGVEVDDRVVADATRLSVFLGAGDEVLLPAATFAPYDELRLDYSVFKTSKSSGLTLRIEFEDQRSDASSSLFDVDLTGAKPGWKHERIDVSQLTSSSASVRIAVDGPADDEKFEVAVADLILLPTPRPNDRPNILLVSLDTLRADHLAIYGYPEDTSPFLTNYVDDFDVYDQAYTTCTWTLPSHAALFTGLYPSEHGAISSKGHLAGKPLPEERVTLAEILSEHGYLTMGVVSGPMLKRNYGVDQGFAYYSDEWRKRRYAEDVNAQALEWLSRVDDRPWFMFLNYFDVHLPADPPGWGDEDHPIFEKYGIDVTTFQWSFMRQNDMDGLEDDARDALLERYVGELRYLDAQLELLFDELEQQGLLEDTIVCFFGDHGESYGENETWGHGGPFLQPQAHVPMMYKNPRDPSGPRRVKDPVSTIEIGSMLLSDLGITDVPPAFERRSRAVYGERFNANGSVRMYMTDGQKYLVRLHNGANGLQRRDQIFDVVADPLEESDLVGGATAAGLRNTFDEFLATTGVAGVEATGFVEEKGEKTAREEELEAELRALGYVD